MPEWLKIGVVALVGAVNALLGIVYANLRGDTAKLATALERVTGDLTNERLANVAAREQITQLRADMQALIEENRKVLLDADQRHHDTLRGMLSTLAEAQLAAFRAAGITPPGH